MELTGSNVAAAGRKIYEGIRKDLEANHWGKLVVIDIHSGDYELGGIRQPAQRHGNHQAASPAATGRPHVGRVDWSPRALLRKTRTLRYGPHHVPERISQ